MLVSLDSRAVEASPYHICDANRHMDSLHGQIRLLPIGRLGVGLFACGCEIAYAGNVEVRDAVVEEQAVGEG